MCALNTARTQKLTWHQAHCQGATSTCRQRSKWREGGQIATISICSYLRVSSMDSDVDVFICFPRFLMYIISLVKKKKRSHLPDSFRNIVALVSYLSYRLLVTSVKPHWGGVRGELVCLSVSCSIKQEQLWHLLHPHSLQLFSIFSFQLRRSYSISTPIRTALCRGSPVTLSQTTMDSRWFVTPIPWSRQHRGVVVKFTNS